MPRPKGVVETERGNWRVVAGTVSLVEALKACTPPSGVGEWTAGRVVSWAVLRQAEQFAQDASSEAERALIKERAAVLRDALEKERTEG